MNLIDSMRQMFLPSQKNYTILDLKSDLGWPDSSSVITPNTSLQSITVMRSVTLLAGLLSSFPVDVMRKTKEGESEEVDHEIDWLFNTEANPENDAIQARWTMNANLLLSGNACAKKVMDGNRVVALWPFRHDDVTFDRFDNGDRMYRVRDLKGRETRYKANEIYHEALWSMDGYVGLSPIAQAKARLSGHISAEKLQAQLYENKPMPGMVLKYKLALNKEKVEKLQDQIAAGFTAYRRGRPAVFGDDPAIDFPTVPLVDLQWLESIQAGEEQIAQMFGIPPVALGIMRKTTSWGSGIEQLNIGFLTYTIQPLLILKEAAMKRQLMTDEQKRRKYFVRHNFAGILRADMKTQAETLAAKVQNSILSPNEARAIEDRKPKPGGDELYMQQQMIPLTADRTPSAPAPAAPAASN